MSPPSSSPPAFDERADSPVRTGWIDVPAAEGRRSAYLALPPAGKGPGLLLLQEIFGVNAHIRCVAQQYALAGYTVLAPDLFWREAPRVALGYVGSDRDRALALMRTLTQDQAVVDMQASLEVLRAHPACAGRVGAIGYCMGGRLAYTAAALCGVDAAVAYYGGGIARHRALAVQVRCPVQFHHAAHDTSISPEDVAAVQAAVAAAPAGAQAEFHVYPGTQHGFNCWARAAHHPAAAALAFSRSLGFLNRLFPQADGG